MTTSTEIIQQIVTSTGQLTTDFMPFLYLFLGIFFAIVFGGAIINFIRKAFKGL